MGPAWSNPQVSADPPRTIRRWCPGDPYRRGTTRRVEDRVKSRQHLGGASLALGPFAGLDGGWRMEKSYSSPPPSVRMRRVPRPPTATPRPDPTRRAKDR
jgi:hypothetical protein